MEMTLQNAARFQQIRRLAGRMNRVIFNKPP